MKRLFIKLSVFMAAFCLLILLLAVYIGHKIEPVLSEMAQSRAASAASQMITEAVSRKIAEGELSYDKLILFEKDLQGNVTALRTNMQQVNILKTKILATINRNLLDLRQDKIGIPLGDMLLPELFMGKGPKIPVRILSITQSGADFTSHFTQAGINQTLHRLNLKIYLEGTILTLGKIQNFSVSGSVLVAETIIVGQVPHTFS